MALPIPPGLMPAEVAFLCEMELVTVVPRQRLDPIPLLGGATPALRPPHRATMPLWLALLLKRQRRANIVAPPWLHPQSLQELVMKETRDESDPNQVASTNRRGGDDSDDEESTATRVRFAPPPPAPVRADTRGTAATVGTARRVNGFVSDPFAGEPIPLSPPFLPSCTAEAPAGYLPYHWFEVAEILVAHAPDDLPAPVGEVRALLRDLVEARAAKVRQLAKVAASKRTHVLGDLHETEFVPAVVSLRGIGAMELAEARGHVTAVHDGMRRLGAAAEASRRDEEDVAGGGGGPDRTGVVPAGVFDDDDDYSDEDMI
ncbi:dna replication complex gins protein psf2 [Ophiostoma piceae UAMH 11346]|uniref:DNA replication complex GINS protein PSF2 n=1 Tax=Ophiostoma piceae (strain UAMH 11346) TaxID=1262450 RepID=S3D041_OPHP1|nr:dna replication complex gins protein psf2 [Ophiostoma piceae UAMH 11346]